MVHLDYESLETTNISDAGLCFEDLIAPRPKQVEAVKRAILYTKRHKRVSVYILMHSTLTNSMHSLLKHADRFVFTKSAANLRNFVDCMAYFCLGRSEAKTQFADFMSQTEKWLYLNFCVADKKITYTKTGDSLPECGSASSGAAGDEQSKKQLEVKRKRFIEMISSLAKSSGEECRIELATHIFDQIVTADNHGRLDSNDLSFGLQRKKKKKRGGKRNAIKRVSIIDLVHCMMHPKIVPNSITIVLFRLLSREVCIPKSFVNNPALWRKKGKKEKSK